MNGLEKIWKSSKEKPRGNRCRLRQSCSNGESSLKMNDDWLNPKLIIVRNIKGRIKNATSQCAKKRNESKNFKTHGTPQHVQHNIYTVPYRKQTGNGPPMHEGVQQYVLHTM